MKILHITNGDFAADLIKQTSFKGDVVTWKDVLFEGPLPEDLDFDELSKTRAKFLSEMNFGSYDEIMADFNVRKKIVEQADQYQEIVMWFEHDVYDQLQLIQVLDFFSDKNLERSKFKIISIGEYPGIVPFLGFGQLSVNQISDLFPKRQTIDANTFALSKKIWRAIRSANPREILHLFTQDLTGLPFIQNALKRYMQEFPSVENGLTKTEKFILNSLKGGINNLATLFDRLPIFEGKYFLGLSDVIFLKITERLCSCDYPLLKLQTTDSATKRDNDIKLATKTIELTDTGMKVLSNEQDFIGLNGIDRWQGGVHLTQKNCWRWDDEQQEIRLGKVSV